MFYYKYMFTLFYLCYVPMYITNTLLSNQDCSFWQRVRIFVYFTDTKYKYLLTSCTRLFNRNDTCIFTLQYSTTFMFVLQSSSTPVLQYSTYSYRCMIRVHIVQVQYRIQIQVICICIVHCMLCACSYRSLVHHYD